MNKSEAMEIVAETKFTDEQLAIRNRHIATLKKFNDLSLEAAKAIAEIKAKKLYHPYKTWGDFCINECGWSRQRFDHIKKLIDVRETLPTKMQTFLQNPKQAEALEKVPQDQRAEVFDEAVRFHAKHGQIPTAKDIQTAKTYKDEVLDDMGYPVPPNALSAMDRKAEVQEILTGLSKAKTRLAEIKDGDPLYRRVNSIRSKRDKLEEYYNELKGALPAYVCYSCDGLKVNGCKMCGGTGVVSEFEWKSKADPQGHERRLEALNGLKDNLPF